MVWNEMNTLKKQKQILAMVETAVSTFRQAQIKSKTETNSPHSYVIGKHIEDLYTMNLLPSIINNALSQCKTL